MIRAIGEIEEELHGVAEAIKMVRDPWIKRSLGRRRRELKDEKIAAEERLRRERTR